MFNILYIHSHDTGRYVQPYGHAVATPRIQRLAEQGVLFRQTFAAAPQCSPSRAALLSGQCPHSAGILGLVNRGFVMANYQQHIVHTLRRAGYHSTLIGVQHVAKDPAEIGYDQVVELPDKSAESVAPAAVEFLSHTPPQPFFLSVGFNQTHRQFPDIRGEDDPRYCLPPQPLPDTPRTRHDMADFKLSARQLDAGIGAVLDALEQNGLAGDTLVICTTDHGLAFPAMKCNLTDHGIGVMLIMRGPHGFSAGRVVDAMASQIDLFPTICELLGIERPAWLQGKSIMPLIRDEKGEINDAVFAEMTFHCAYEPQRAVRTRRWKYIRRFLDYPTALPCNCDDGLSKQVWVEQGWGQRPMAAEQLYDLVFDPQEANNVVGDPHLAGVLEEMRGRLAHWMEETRDPLLAGPIGPPPDTLVSDPQDTAPWEVHSVRHRPPGYS